MSDEDQGTKPPNPVSDPDSILDELIEDGEAAKARMRGMAAVGAAPAPPGVELLHAGSVALRYGGLLLLHGGVEFAKAMALGEVVGAYGRRWGRALHERIAPR